MDDTTARKIATGVKALTIAVWCLVAVNVIQMVAWTLPVISPGIYTRHASSTSGVTRQAFESWEGISLEEKINRASMIVITEFRRDGDKLRAIIKDIPKRKPDITFYYSVGEEYPPMTVTVQENTRYGDGNLVLLQGSPATMKEAYSIYNGGISGLGDIPLTKVRAMIEQSK